MVNQCLQQGQAIAQSYEIRKTSENTWLVPSQSGNGIYEVTKLGETYAYTCKDFEYRTHMIGNCKHCFALDYYLRLQGKVSGDVEEQLVEQANPEDISLYVLIAGLHQLSSMVNVIREY
jgi:hypothetical protein